MSVMVSVMVTEKPNSTTPANFLVTIRHTECSAFAGHDEGVDSINE